MPSPLWTPSPDRVAATRLTAFMQAASRFEVPITDYSALYEFSISRPADFWRLMWEFGGVRGTMGERIVENLDRMPGAVFFPDATLNFADNLLADRSSSPALIFKGEDRPLRTLTRAELYHGCRRLRGRAAQGRRQARRSRRRLCAEPAGSDCRGSWRQLRSARCGRPARQISGCRACSIASARSSRRCSLLPTVTNTAESVTIARPASPRLCGR